MVHQMTSAAARLPVEGELPSLANATVWLNSEPLTPAGLRGKVVLVEFGTYTCINWLRTLPYVRAWAKKYRDQGLVVIQVHAPEFEFEKNLESVRRELKREGVNFPVAVDNEHAIWRAFGNQYWPALYFVDGKGNIRHHQFGEGDYEHSEEVIQQLLAEAGKADVSGEPVSVDGAGCRSRRRLGQPEISGELCRLWAHRELRLSRGAVADQRRVYAAPARLKLNQWALSGDWTMGKQATVLNKANGRIVYRFHARDLHLVMGPAARGASCDFGCYRWKAAGRCSRHRRRRTGQRHGRPNSGCIS